MILSPELWAISRFCTWVYQMHRKGVACTGGLFCTSKVRFFCVDVSVRPNTSLCEAGSNSDFRFRITYGFSRLAVESVTT